MYIRIIIPKTGQVQALVVLFSIYENYKVFERLFRNVFSKPTNNPNSYLSILSEQDVIFEHITKR
jgi:hypothetical protein